MRDELESLSSAIDLYKSASELGDTGGDNIQDTVRIAIQNVWNILGTNGVTIGRIANSFMRSGYGSVEEYKARLASLQVSYTENNIVKFSKELLALFGVSNPDMFIIWGKIERITRPILDTKLQVNDIINDESQKISVGKTTGHDLEGISAIVSMYIPTFEALMSSKNGINEIIKNELIRPLAEDAPFIQRQYGKLINGYEKKENKLLEISLLERKIENLKFLKKRGMTNDVKKTEGLISKRSSELATLVEQIDAIKDPFSLDDISVYILKKFGFYNKRKKRNYPEMITAEKIKGKIRRSISVGVHKKHAELRNIRIIEGSILRMIKMFEKIKEQYGKLIDEAEDPMKKAELINLLRIELDNWEIESNTLIEGFSFRNVRLLRDQIIAELLSKR